MRRVPCAGLLMALLGCTVAAARRAADGPPLKVKSLRFMAGSWVGEQAGATLEEHWTAPAAGCLMGMFRQTRGETTSVREFEVIEEIGPDVVMTIKHYTPDLKEIPGRVLVRKLVAVKENEAVFESTGEGPKQKLIYRLEGSTLHAKIELTRNGQPVTLDIAMKRVEAK